MENPHDALSKQIATRHYLDKCFEGLVEDGISHGDETKCSNMYFHRESHLNFPPFFGSYENLLDAI